MELLIAYAVFWAFLTFGAVVATFAVGGLMGMEIPSWRGLAWRSIVAAGATMLFFSLATEFLRGLGWWLWLVPTCLVLAGIYRLDFRADLPQLAFFTLLMYVSGVAGQFIVASIIGGAPA